jgi:two-component system LytT family response regulator
MISKLTAIIVDDEDDGRNTLKRYLQQYCPEVNLLAEACSVKEAEQVIKQYHPQLVFLDINMPGENGFSLFERIKKPLFKTIFVTAYDEYAIQAIRQNALDYILKPINIDELVGAVSRALHLPVKAPDVPGIASFLQSLQRLQAEGNKLALPVLDGFIYVPVNDIVRCEAEGNYTFFYFSNRPKTLVCKTLGYYEITLKESGFARVHHHHLINLKHVERYQKGRGGLVYLSDKSEIAVSQRKREEFLLLLNNFSGPAYSDDINV